MISQILLSKFYDLHKKTGKLAEEAVRVGTKTFKTLRTVCASNREKIVVDDEEVDDVEEFTSLRAILDKEGGGHYPPSAESTWRIPETTEDLGS